MNMVILIFLYVVTILFYLLESSFESFSRISLAKFLNGLPPKRKPNFAFVEKFDLVIHSLETVVFLSANHPARSAPFEPWKMLSYQPSSRILLIGLLYLFFFNLLFYITAYLNREKILRNLLFLFPVAWIIFYPLNFIFRFFLTGKPGRCP